MQPPSSELSALAVTAISTSPLEALASELGAETARIRRELRTEFELEKAQQREVLESVRREAAEIKARALAAEQELRAVVQQHLSELPDIRDTVLRELGGLEHAAAARAAALVPPPDPAIISAAVAEALDRREADIVARAAALVPVQQVAEQAALLVPPPEPTVPPEPPDVAAAVAEAFDRRQDDIIERAAALVHVPEAPLLPDIDGLVGNAVAAAMSTVRVPVDGRNADPLETAAVVREAVAAAVAAAVAKEIDALPPAPTEAEQRAAIDAIVAETVARSLSDIPIPRDGESVTVDDVRPLIEAEIDRQLTAVPPPPDAAALAAAVALEIERQLPETARQAAALVPPAETPDVGTIVSAEFERQIPEAARQAAALVPPVEPPDVAPLVSAEFERLQDDIVMRAAALVPPGTVDEAELRALIHSLTSEDLAVPERLAGLIENAAELLEQPFAMPPEAANAGITVNVGGAAAQRKIIRKLRDADGNPVFEVTEHLDDHDIERGED